MGKDLPDVKILKFFNFFDKRSEWIKNRNKINPITNSFLFFLNPHKNLTFLENEHRRNGNVRFIEYSIEDSINILNGSQNFVSQQNINNIIDRDTFINFLKKNLDINSFTLIQFFNNEKKILYYRFK